MSVLLAGGGTAGHVSPLLAVADALRRRDPDLPVHVLGTEAGLEAVLVPPRGYPLLTVPRVPMPRRAGADLARLPGRLGVAVGAASRAVRETRARVVVGFGGYVSTPAYLAARRRGVPIVVHEQNARPGLANQLGARLTTRVATTFPSTRLPHAQVIGMPLRREISRLDRPAARRAAAAALGLDPTRLTLLVVGGSLGAQRLNEVVPRCGALLADAGVQVLHVTGRGKQAAAPVGSGSAPVYRTVEYLEEVETGYAVADLVLARAGASTVCELAAVGLPAVYVPLPVGNGEQALNARPVVDAGGALLVPDDQLTTRRLQDTLLPLLADPARLSAMSLAAAAAGHRDADERLADLVVQAMGAR